MTLLDFARGPALQWALIILVVGVLWRLLGTLFLLRGRDLSQPRSADAVIGGLRTIVTRSWPPKQFARHTMFQHITGFIFHLGLFIVILLFVPHIEFFKGLFGFGWPGLPNDLVMVAGALTLAVLIALLIRRLTHPVLKIISGPDDYISWLLTTLPLATGLLAYAHLGARYETMLALHLLSVEALMVWFPFGKLMHAILVIPSRAQMGAMFARRGVKV